MLIVVMGVAGSGKTTVGKALAESLGWSFLDADDLHPPANRVKLTEGIPLTDEDRKPWLDAVHDYVSQHERRGDSIVLACSALKQVYRSRLSEGLDQVAWVHLHGQPEDVRRLLERRSGHFMNPALLMSQFETLEPPEDALQVPVTLSVNEQVKKIRNHLGQ